MIITWAGYIFAAFLSVVHVPNPCGTYATPEACEAVMEDMNGGDYR